MLDEKLQIGTTSLPPRNATQSTSTGASTENIANEIEKQYSNTLQDSPFANDKKRSLA